MTGPVNRDGLNLDALDEKPVTYSGGVPAGRENDLAEVVVDVAYHPVLPLVACVGNDFSIVCDRETAPRRRRHTRLRRQTWRMPASNGSGSRPTARACCST